MAETVRTSNHGCLHWLKYAAVALATTLLGVLPGIFVVFLSVFGDVHSMADRVGVELYVFGVYLFLALVIAVPTRSRTLPLWLGLAGTVILIRYAQQEPDIAGVAWVSFAMMLAGTGLGTFGGLWIRTAWSRRRGPV